MIYSIQIAEIQLLFTNIWIIMDFLQIVVFHFSFFFLLFPYLTDNLVLLGRVKKKNKKKTLLLEIKLTICWKPYIPLHLYKGTEIEPTVYRCYLSYFHNNRNHNNKFAICISLCSSLRNCYISRRFR